MRSGRFVKIWVAALMVLSLGTSIARAGGLYDDDKNVTSGDLKDRDYWRAKWADERIDEAIKERQPEGAIGMELISQVNLLDGLIKDHPKHEQLQKWKAHAVSIQKKIGEDFNRSDSFKPGCLWNEYAYREAYVGLNCGKVAAADKDWPMAADCFRESAKQLGFLQKRLENNERTANWPPEFVKWINDTKPEVEQLRDDAAKKT
jgi:hypothetical protein